MENNINDTYRYSAKRTQAMVQWFADNDYNYFVTLAFNQKSTSADYARNTLKRFSARLDRVLLGSDWCKKPCHERTAFFAYPEHMSSNFHYHLVMVVNEKDKQDIATVIDKCWQNLVYSGSTDVQCFTDHETPEKGVKYCLKDQIKNENYENFIVNSEFFKS